MFGTNRRPARRAAALATTLSLVLVGCGNDSSGGNSDTEGDDTAAATTVEETTPDTSTDDQTGDSMTDESMVDDTMSDDSMSDDFMSDDSMVDDSMVDDSMADGDVAIDAERCDANTEAGKITFLTGFDFAAASSIVEVIYAKDQGLYDQLCLDVELASSFSTANYGLVDSGQGQFASGGSFSEALAAAGAEGANISVVTVDGRVPIDTLMLKPGFDSLESVKGQQIGVKGKLPPSIQVMLSGAGLELDTDYQTVLLDGFDPTAHYAIENIAGFPGWRSNEPGRLTAAGLEFTQFDAEAADVPGSFGVIIANNDFVAEHPTAAEDFVRATMKGLELAMDDPAGAAAAAVSMVEANGNPNFLSPEGETFRWETEADILDTNRPNGHPVGYPDVDALQGEVDAYTPTGLFEGIELPSVDDFVNLDLADGVTDGDTVVWPG